MQDLQGLAFLPSCGTVEEGAGGGNRESMGGSSITSHTVQSLCGDSNEKRPRSNALPLPPRVIGDIDIDGALESGRDIETEWIVEVTSATA